MKAIDGSLVFQVLTDGSIFGGDYDGRLGPLTDWANLCRHLFKDKTILDLGSNAGHFPIEYIRAGAKKVYAVEGRQEFLDQWKEFSPLVPLDLSTVEWHTSDVRDFGMPGKVDIVSCLGLLYHVAGFMPRLRELSEHAEFVLIEVQVGGTQNGSFSEKPDNRTQALKEEEVPHFSNVLWEKVIHRYFGEDFNVSRIWLLAYGDVINAKRGDYICPEPQLTLRAFYLLPRKGADLNYIISDKTGCFDITKQTLKVYQNEIKS
jgi:SAM-dependent methyltransferase